MDSSEKNGYINKLPLEQKAIVRGVAGAYQSRLNERLADAYEEHMEASI